MGHPPLRPFVMARPHPCLDPDSIRQGAAEASLGDAALNALLTLAQRIRQRPELERPVLDAHRAVYDEDGPFEPALAAADAALAGDQDLLHALFVLDSLRLVRERQAARGVDPAITRAINARHGVAWLRRAVDASGVPRLAAWLPFWFRLVGSGELYRLGRLELAPARWHYPYRAYVNDRSGDTVVLAESGLGFDAEGRRAEPGAVTSRLFEAEDAVLGTPISPRGRALPRSVRLPSHEWSLALTQGDWILDLHVPAEGTLDLPSIARSLADAERFFARLYPARPFVAYVCDSWLFADDLETFVGEPSRIVDWQRQGYLLPGSGGHDSFLSFVFGSPRVEPSTAPRDTRLRRAVIEHLERGGRLHDGVFLLLARDVARFGHTPYRERTERALGALLEP